MDSLYLLGARSIKLLQDTFPNSTNYFIFVSEAADPGKTISVIFPASCVLSLSLGINIAIASVIAEWSNILLKWILMEHRPFWWVNLGPGRPTLRQTKLSCETGPGSPSGHLTVVTVVCFLIAQWLCKTINERTLIRRVYKRRINNLIWLILWFIIINVTLCRMYHAAHFPHQCILGIFAGLFIGKLTWKYSERWFDATPLKWFLVSLIFVVTGIGAYLLQMIIGVDPNWSVQLAWSWCSKGEYLHAETTPLFTFVRDASVIFGFALCAPLSKRTGYNFSKAIAAVLFFITYMWYQMMAKYIPAEKLIIFYAGYFQLYAVYVYFTVAIIPHVSHLFLSYVGSQKV